MQPYQHIPAHPSLLAVITGFSQRSFADARGPALRLPARTDAFLEFYLAEPYGVRRQVPGTVSAGDAHGPESVPMSTLVLPHLHPGTELFIEGRIDTFTVHFSPTGCHRLFGIDLAPLHDQGVPAGEVLTPQLERLRAALARTPDVTERVALAQAWFADRLQRARPADAIDHAAEALRSDRPPVRMATLAAQAGVSERHLSRVLTQRLGASPRLYARLGRFQALLQAHAARPGLPLAQLAQLAHYFDQAHLVRECRAFTGQVPSRFLQAWLPAARIGL